MLISGEKSIPFNAETFSIIKTPEITKLINSSIKSESKSPSPKNFKTNCTVTLIKSNIYFSSIKTKNTVFKIIFPAKPLVTASYHLAMVFRKTFFLSFADVKNPNFAHAKPVLKND